MAFSTYVGSFTVPAATGNKAVTGVGFQPKAILFWGNRRSTDGTSGNGSLNAEMPVFYGVATSSSARGAVATGDDYASTATQVDTTKCIRHQTSGASVNYAADFVSFDADGFTVNFTTANATAYVINFQAFGGSDLTNAIVLNNTSPASTGNQAWTGAGFQPTSAIFIGSQTTTATYSHIASVGFAASTTSRGQTWCGYTGASSSYQRTSKVFATCGTTSSIIAECDLNSFDSDGLTLNWSTASTGFTVLALLFKGGQAKVGAISQKTSTGTQATTGVGFTPTGLLFGSAGRTSSASVLTSPGALAQSVGAASGTTARAVTYVADGGAGVAALDRANVYKINSDSTTPSVTAASDLSSFDADGFTLNFGTADATAREILFLAFGSSASGNQTLTPTAVTDSWTVPAPVMIKNRTLTATVVTASWVPGTAKVNQRQTVTVTTASWTTPTATVVPIRTIAATGVVDTWVVGTATVVGGPVTTTATAVVDTWVVGTAALVTGGSPQTLTPTVVSSSWIIPAPTVVSPVRLVQTAVSDSWVVGTPAVVATVSLTPTASTATWVVVPPVFVGGLPTETPILFKIFGRRKMTSQ